jgi:Zn-dependent peptidase ImmA (M78 family)
VSFPKLPTQVLALGGPVTVRMVKPWADADAFGLWHRAKREIHVDGNLTPELQWSTYYHEWVHTALDDTGLAHLLTEAQQEALCDAFSTARMRERFG